MKALPWIIAVCSLALAGHSWIHLQAKTESLKETVSLIDQARKIDNDQIRDLMHELRATHQITEAEKTRYFVLGALDHMHQPEHYSEIWHDGYNRGTEVQKMANEAIKDQKASSEEKSKAYNADNPREKSEIPPLSPTNP